MKTTCSTEDLRTSINHAHLMTVRHANLPSLKSVCIHVTKEKGILIRSTNLQIGFEAIIPARIEREGMVAIDGGFLGVILASLNSDVVTLEISEKSSSLQINTNSSKSSMSIVSSEDFPELPVGENLIHDVRVRKGDFIEALRSVVYSALVSDTKPEISSVYMFSDERVMTCVSTDSYRLSEKSVPVIVENSDTTLGISGVLIPVKNAHLLLKVLEHGDPAGILHMQLFGKEKPELCTWKWDQRFITSYLIDGAYPDYAQIIPKTSTTEITLLKSDLIQALRVLNVFADKYAQVDMKIETNPEGKRIIRCLSNTTEKGNTNIEIPGSIVGEDITLRFNSRYLQDCIPSIDTESISLSMTEPNRPILIKPIGDTSFQYLVMPLNR